MLPAFRQCVQLVHTLPSVSTETRLDLRHIVDRRCVADVDIVRLLQQGVISHLIDNLAVLFAFLLQPGAGKQMVALQ